MPNRDKTGPSGQGPGTGGGRGGCVPTEKQLDDIREAKKGRGPCGDGTPRGGGGGGTGGGGRGMGRGPCGGGRRRGKGGITYFT